MRVAIHRDSREPRFEREMGRVKGAAWDKMLGVVSDPLLGWLAAEDLVAPCFHLVTEGETPTHVRHLFRCPNARQFTHDLDWMLKGRTPVSLNQLHACAKLGRKLPRRPIFVSFDDGMREMADVVAPLCRAKGIPVTFFLTTGFLNNRSLFFRHKASILIDRLAQQPSGSAASAITAYFTSEGVPVRDVSAFLLGIRYRESHWLDQCAQLAGLDFDEYLRAQRPYLTDEQVQQLISMGFSVGGHSVDHPLFADLNLEEQIQQTVDCLEYLSSRFRVEVRAFAFPFVATGVAPGYYEATLGQRFVDLLFGIGSLPAQSYNGRLIERFGVESNQNESAVNAWREHARRRTKQRIDGLFGGTT
jgi:peptidoglycan/xylan/chitin deacetylase (PgdA/CDA1 family)